MELTHAIMPMHHNSLRRRRNENPIECAARVARATRHLVDDEDFELRVVLYLRFGKGRTPEEIGDVLDMTPEDVHELRRKALRCL